MHNFYTYLLLLAGSLYPGIGAIAQVDSTVIGLIGCHNQHAPAPALDFMADRIKPQYVVWLGDNVYSDTHDNIDHKLEQLNKLAARPAFSRLRNQSVFLVTWDDHDYGENNAGKDYPLRELSKQLHRRFWQLKQEIPENQDGVYYARSFQQANGKVIQFIMLDGRFNREDPRKRHADAFGENQWRFIEMQLKQPADLRFIVLGYQILLQRPTRWEALIKLGNCRRRLFDLIENMNGGNVLFLTGDQHTAEVLRSPYNIRYKTFEIMACGINQTERPGLALNRVAGPDRTLHSSPHITIYWTADPYVEVKNHQAETGKQTMFYRINLRDIGYRK